MDDNTCFALYAVEANVGELRTGTPGQDYHAFLVLRDETPDRPHNILEELHFTMQTRGLKEGQKPYIHAISKVGVPRDFGALEKRCYITGSREEILPLWGKVIDIGVAIGNLKKEFTPTAEPDAINCRAGVKGIIDTLGLEFRPVIEGNNAIKGTQSNLAGELPAHVLEDSLSI